MFSSYEIISDNVRLISMDMNTLYVFTNSEDKETVKKHISNIFEKRSNNIKVIYSDDVTRDMKKDMKYRYYYLVLY